LVLDLVLAAFFVCILVFVWFVLDYAGNELHTAAVVIRALGTTVLIWMLQLSLVQAGADSKGAELQLNVMALVAPLLAVTGSLIYSRHRRRAIVCAWREGGTLPRGVSRDAVERYVDAMDQR